MYLMMYIVTNAAAVSISPVRRFLENIYFPRLVLPMAWSPQSPDQCPFI